MTTLKQARLDPKAMEQFVAEHEADQIESVDFDKVFSSMTAQETPTIIQATSSKGGSDDYT